jgi:chromosome segregation ATPase
VTSTWASARVNSLILEMETELKSLGEKRLEYQQLHDQVLHDEFHLQHVIETLTGNITLCDLKAVFVKAAIANAQNSTRTTRLRLASARDDYVAMLQRRLCHTETNIRRLREEKARCSEKVRNLATEVGESRRNQREAAQELCRYFGTGCSDGTRGTRPS